MRNSVFNMPPWDGEARPVAFMWRLIKCGREGRCRIWTHPHGGELRVEADGECVRREIGTDVETLIQTALMWRTHFEKEGWPVSRNPPQLPDRHAWAVRRIVR